MFNLRLITRLFHLHSKLNTQVPLPLIASATITSFRKYSTKPLDLAEFARTVERVPGTTPGRAFLDAWIIHLSTNPSQIPLTSWPALIDLVKSSDRTVNDTNFGAVLLQQCIKFDCIPIAEEYLKFNTNPNLAILSLYIYLIGKDGEAGTLDEPRIFKLYEMIKAKNQGIWDLDTAERVTRILAKTSRWKECLEIFELMKFSGKPSAHASGEVIASAFKAGEFDYGWALMTDLDLRKPSQKAVLAWLQHAPKTEQSLQKLFDYMDCFDFHLTTVTIQGLVNFFTQLNYKSLETSLVPRTGHCRMCNSPLSKNALTPEEYAKLTEAFLNKVLVDEDVFLNSTPKEVEDYKAFIDRKGSFDIVLDALNIVYSLGRDKRNKDQSILLDHVISGLAQQGQRVLLIGRAHMRKWPNMNRIAKNASIYLISDTSQDDPFIIYATMKSGRDARFVSKDFLRNHLYRLKDPELGRLFRRWRIVHQMILQFRGEEFRGLMPFTQMAPVAQKNETSRIWHVPFDDEDKLKSPNDIPERWLCVVPIAKS